MVAYSVKFRFVSALLGVQHVKILCKTSCTEGMSVSKRTLISISRCRNFSTEGRNAFVFFGCERLWIVWVYARRYLREFTLPSQICNEDIDLGLSNYLYTHDSTYFHTKYIFDVDCMCVPDNTLGICCISHSSNSSFLIFSFYEHSAQRDEIANELEVLILNQLRVRDILNTPSIS